MKNLELFYDYIPVVYQTEAERTVQILLEIRSKHFSGLMANNPITMKLAKYSQAMTPNIFGI